MFKVLVFAGPNGSGKSTIAAQFPIAGTYVNADDIKKTKNCSALEAAVEAEKICYRLIDKGQDLTFETVLSSDFKLKLLEYAREKNYQILAIYVTTNNPEINVQRVHWRMDHGGHPVPDERIRSRYYKSLQNLSKLANLADTTYVYDNTGDTPSLICKADRNNGREYYPTEYWTRDQIAKIL